MIVLTSAELAQRIQDIENKGYGYYRDNVEKWSLERSEDDMCLYIWRDTDNQDGPCLKTVPAFHFSVEEIERILDAQPWVFL